MEKVVYEEAPRQQGKAVTVSEIERTMEKIARVCHEANRAYCITLEDFSQVPWDAAPQWQKDSAKLGVAFHIYNLEATPEDSHNSWLAEKEKAGWKFGPVKDEEKKEHPCFVPYAALPVEQKMKDYIFRNIVHAYLEAYLIVPLLKNAAREIQA